MAEQLRITYDGPALAEGRMEVRDLAPSLLAFADLVKALHQEVHPEDPDVSVHVVATRRGSFEVDLNVATGLVETVKRIFTANEAVAAINLAQSIALLAALVALLRRLLRRRIVGQRMLANGQVLLELDDGDVIEVDPRVLQLARVGRIRRFLREWFAPLERDGVTVVRLTHGDRREEVTAEELPAFDVPTTPDEFLGSQTVELWVGLQAPSFARDNKWKLTRGNEAFWATIADERFLDLVARNQERFAAGDALKVRIRTDQYMSADGIKADNCVLHVLDHTQGRPAGDVPLPFDDPPALT